MMPDEKEQLLSLLGHPGNWCRDAEARDKNGNAVTYSDQSAVSWDITGALCRLFGWQRACLLFQQVDKHFFGKRRRMTLSNVDPGIDAMKALQDYNDSSDTTFFELRDRIAAMPVWQRNVCSDQTGDNGHE